MIIIGHADSPGWLSLGQRICTLDIPKATMAAAINWIILSALGIWKCAIYWRSPVDLQGITPELLLRLVSLVEGIQVSPVCGVPKILGFFKNLRKSATFRHSRSKVFELLEIDLEEVAIAPQYSHLSLKNMIARMDVVLCEWILKEHLQGPIYIYTESLSECTLQ